jgi:hypothetical protein
MRAVAAGDDRIIVGCQRYSKRTFIDAYSRYHFISALTS